MSSSSTISHFRTENEETQSGSSPVAVSVILPVFNEAAYIEETMRSLLQQDASNCSVEILVVDGGSSDGTREMVQRFARAYPFVRLLENPGRKTPIAMNIGLRAANGEYACIFGAHAKYFPDYIRVCLKELQDKQAAGCSGRLITAPSNSSLGARLAAWCLGHRFASSGRSVRTHQGGYVDTVAFPVMRKQVLLDAGGYDENLERNQDNDMNRRLRAAGHRLYLTPLTQAIYYARPGVLSLLRHAYTTGKWNGMTARLHLAAMSLRHFVPLAFLLTIVALGSLAVFAGMTGGSPLVPLTGLGVLVAAHLLVGMLAGIETVVCEHCASAMWLPPVILAFHLAYGAGTAAGALSLSTIDISSRRKALELREPMQNKGQRKGSLPLP